MLHQNLQNLGFTEINGLVLTKNWKQHPIAIELLHLKRAVELGASAVFFRRKYENNELKHSEPVLYIFEQENFINSQEHKDLHAKIWSASEIEVYFILSNTEIHIFNARKPAEIQNTELSLTNLRLAKEALTEFNDFHFSTFLFQSGTFWEQESMQKNLDINKSPYAILLDNLKNTRKKLHLSFKKEEEQQALDKLLLLTVLVKFLEDKKDNEGRFALQEKYKDYGVNSFAEILTKDNQGFLCIEFINDIASTYNGKIFNILAQEEIEFIEKTNLQILADFIKGDIRLKDKQFSIWKQYAFDYLPVELLSAIYEDFLEIDNIKLDKKTKNGVVYTPPFLVNFLIDEVMPLSKAKEYFETNSFKVLDPACGSGVFLVAAYKRMLQWWYVNEYRKTGKIPEKFEPKICKTILEQNVFGVDIEKTATQITIFSLTIAYLDILDPKTEWETIKFQDLTKNIFGQDFFVWQQPQNIQKFDLVLGNPPFVPVPKSLVADNLNIQAIIKNRPSQSKSTRTSVPNDLAFYFFEQTMLIADKVCLIVPSSNLLYSKSSQEYREAIFSSFSVEKIFDFTHLRRELFNADVSTLCLIATPKKSQQSIEHIVVKRLIGSEKKFKFEIDHYDRHVVRQDWACNENLSFTWKTNLLGGGRLFHLIYRLSLLETLEDFIKSKQSNSNHHEPCKVTIIKQNGNVEFQYLPDTWVYNIGYVKGASKKKFPSPHLYNKDQIITETFEEDGSFETTKQISLEVVEPRNPLLFEAPLIVIKALIGKNNIPIRFMETSVCFKDRFVGIHAPLIEKSTLLNIAENIKIKYNKLYMLYAWATSPEALVNQENTIGKTDIDALPFPENEDYLQLSKSEQILQNDVLEYYIHLGKSIDKIKTGGKLLQPTTKIILEDFGKAFCDLLNPIYAKNGNSWHSGKWHKIGDFIIYPFGYGVITNEIIDFVASMPEIGDVNEKALEILVKNREQNKSADYVRVVRVYDHVNNYDVVCLVKPNLTKYWLQSIALRDADETYMDLKKAGF